MAKSDPEFTPTVWTKTVGDQTYERSATSIADEVQYRFDGWLPKNAKAEVANAAAAVKATEPADEAKSSKSTTTAR